MVPVMAAVIIPSIRQTMRTGRNSIRRQTMQIPARTAAYSTINIDSTHAPTIHRYAQAPTHPPRMRYQRRMPLFFQYRNTAPSTPQTRKYKMSSTACKIRVGTVRLPNGCTSSAVDGRIRIRRSLSSSICMRVFGITISLRTPISTESIEKPSYTAPSRRPNSRAAGIARISPAALASAKMACSVAMSYPAAVIGAGAKEIRRPCVPRCPPYNRAHRSHLR